MDGSFQLNGPTAYTYNTFCDKNLIRLRSIKYLTSHKGVSISNAHYYNSNREIMNGCYVVAQLLKYKYRAYHPIRFFHSHPQLARPVFHRVIPILVELLYVSSVNIIHCRPFIVDLYTEYRHGHAPSQRIEAHFI